MASNMLLYWGSGSIPSWKAMIVLEEKQLQGYTSKFINFSKKEHKSEEVLKLNPRGTVPTFRDGDVVIYESNAVCDYLEYKYADKGKRLLPLDAGQRAKVLQRVHESQNLVRALMEGIVFYIFRTKPEDRDKNYLDGKKKGAHEELQRWEDYMAKQGEGSYVVGGEFTMADVLVFPVLAFGVRGSLKLEQFPALQAYYKRVAERPTIKASWPPHWKESPSTDFFVGV